MNLPNKLTVGRFFLTVVFVATISVEFPYHFAVALVLFAVAGVTDYVDGEIARRYALITDFGKLMDPLADKLLIIAALRWHLETNFGRLMDPLVDKIMTTGAFVCLVPLKAIPAWAAIIVIIREFLITGLRLLAVSKGRVLAADPIGKHKTSWQIATVVFFLVLLAYKEWQSRDGDVPGDWWEQLWSYGGWAVSGIAVGLTLYSGIEQNLSHLLPCRGWGSRKNGRRRLIARGTPHGLAGFASARPRCLAG